MQQGVLRRVGGPGRGERAETHCYAPASAYHPTPHPYYYYYYFGWHPQYESWRQGFFEDVAAVTPGDVAN